ncbi:MAG: hypothetical protein GF419_07385 [Ignavibacteriales bacterium]|nr:hypothetical protein [Ignavibacteriales bacterium]
MAAKTTRKTAKKTAARKTAKKSAPKRTAKQTAAKKTVKKPKAMTVTELKDEIEKIRRYAKSLKTKAKKDKTLTLDAVVDKIVERIERNQ